MIKVTQVKALPNYILSLTFNDGVQGEVSIKERLFGEVFEPLKDTEYFNLVSIDPHGVIFWPNNADLASDVLYEKIKLRH